MDRDSSIFSAADGLHLEDVVQITGTVVKRMPEANNPAIATGEIEVLLGSLKVLSRSKTLPFQVNNDEDVSEELLLKFRYLAMRRRRLRDNLQLRSVLIAKFREKLGRDGFVDVQTPLLTASSPEGARDFLVPSRLHPGLFFALPQSPQQFKQLLMVGGVERYFQIAPCLRDEAARADRSPAEHYQVDLEMSFVDREDVFAAIERVVPEVFRELAGDRYVSPAPFRRIPYDEALERYGSDKPDLRNPLLIHDVTKIFTSFDVPFELFRNKIASGAVVRAIAVPEAQKPRSWFDRWTTLVKEGGGGGLAYVTSSAGDLKGTLAKFLSPEVAAALKECVDCETENHTIFFICEEPQIAATLAGSLRTALANDLRLIDEHRFEFCWIIDFPMYELDSESGQLQFGHNPFSMPLGGLEALRTTPPLDVVAQQYDLVCNGYELCSGAVRNHDVETMVEAFRIAGYSRDDVYEKFTGLINAFQYGAPPHAGCALGVDRMVMLLADEPNLRQVIAFPMNQQQQDLLMGAPARVLDERLKEVHIAIRATDLKNEQERSITS